VARRLGIGYPGVKSLGEACAKTGWPVRAYGLIPNQYGKEIAESAEAKAEGVVEAKLRRRGWSEMELRERAKGDLGKVAMAVRLAWSGKLKACNDKKRADKDWRKMRYGHGMNTNCQSSDRPFHRATGTAGLNPKSDGRQVFNPLE